MRCTPRPVVRTRGLFFAVILTGASGSGCHWGLLGTAIGASGADGPYVPGRIAEELGSARVRTLGCLDVGIAPIGDRIGIVDVHVGNRCTHPERIDVAKMVVTSEGEKPIALFDPRREIVRLHVGGAERGLERIRFEGMYGTRRLCFDLGAIAPDAPEARPLSMCFRRDVGMWLAEESS